MGATVGVRDFGVVEVAVKGAACTTFPLPSIIAPLGVVKVFGVVGPTGAGMLAGLFVGAVVGATVVGVFIVGVLTCGLLTMALTVVVETGTTGTGWL